MDGKQKTGEYKLRSRRILFRPEGTWITADVGGHREVTQEFFTEIDVAIPGRDELVSLEKLVEFYAEAGCVTS